MPRSASIAGGNAEITLKVPIGFMAVRNYLPVREID